MGAFVKRQTDEAPAYDRVVVLAVAIEEYQNPPGRTAIAEVRHAIADAEAFVETIERVYDGLVEVEAHRLIGGHATLTTIAQQARYLISSLCRPTCSSSTTRVTAA